MEVIFTMVNYRRSQLAGGTFFFTVNLRDRSADTLVAHVGLLRQSFRHVKEQQPFDIEAVVVLPEHLHLIMTLPEGDNNYPGRWRAIKSHFGRSLKKAGVVLKQNKKDELDLWQRRYWEHQIRDDRDRQNHVDYIHYNPVKHGHVQRVVDWPHSSFHRYVREGLLGADWGGSAAMAVSHGFGE